MRADRRLLPRAPLIRAGRDGDAAALIALIGACWAEYPGCVMDLDEVPELSALASHYAARGGALWVADVTGTGPVGVIAAAPAGAPWAISRLYVAAPERGSGLADRLLDAAEAHAVEHGARCLELWTDTRFTRAHRFYARRRYVATGETRALGDRSNTVEARLVRTLPAAAEASSRRPLPSASGGAI